MGEENTTDVPNEIPPELISLPPRPTSFVLLSNFLSEPILYFFPLQGEADDENEQVNALKVCCSLFVRNL
jgi:hypothetical protein